MQRKYLLRAALILLMITGSYLVLWSSSKTGNNDGGKCTESMEDCCKNKQHSSGTDEMIWENISRPFFSFDNISN